MKSRLEFLSRVEWLPFLPVIVLPFLLLSDQLLAGKALFWGLPALQFNPWRWFAWESLRQGILPLWNPLNGMGAPLAANYQLAFFYPPGWLVYLFAAFGGAPAMAWAHTLLVALHLAWAGAGMALLLHSFGVSRLAQAVGGLAFGLCGYFTARTSVFPMVWTGAWLPWVIIYAGQIAVPGMKARMRFPLIPTGLVICLAFMLLAGHAQVAWYSLLLSGAWVLAGGWTQGRWKGMALSAGRLCLAGLLAGGIAAVQLIPTGEYLLQSQRASAVDYQLAMGYSFWPWRLLVLLAPNLFGSPGLGNYWGYGAYWEDAIYLGLLPFLLALGTLRGIRMGRKKGVTSPNSGLITFLWCMVLIAFLLALGKNTPIFPFLYRHIPTFAMFQAPARYLILAEFALALLAGLGANEWKKPGGKRLRALKRVIVAAFAVTVGAGLALFVLKDIQASFIPATALAGVWGLVAGLLTLRMPPVEEEKRWKNWSWAVVAWIGADLIVAAWGLHPGVAGNFYKVNGPGVQPIQQAAQGGRIYLSAKDEFQIKFSRFFRFSDFHAIEDWDHIRLTLLPNMNLMDGIASANNFDPLVPARYAAWMQRLEKMRPETRTPWLQLMGVSQVEQIDIWSPQGVQNQTLEDARRWYWTACASAAVSEEDAWAQVSHLLTATDRDWVVLEGTGQSLGCQKNSKASIQPLPGGHLDSYRVEAKQPGWLVVADSWYPGWKAWIDGQPAALLRANDLFRAVAIPPGQHMVVFTYEPMSYSWGFLATCLALLLLAGIWIWNRGGLFVRHVA